MDTANHVQILVESVCISDSGNTFRKDMSRIILPSAMGK